MSKYLPDDPNDDDDEDEEEEEAFNGGEEEEEDTDYSELLERREALDFMQIEIMQADQRRQILNRVVAMLENSFLWKFYGKAKRIRLISETFENFLGLIHMKGD